MTTRFLHVLVLCALGACADEKPDQRLVQSEHDAAARDQRAPENTRRQRTMAQGESGRIYEGALR